MKYSVEKFTQLIGSGAKYPTKDQWEKSRKLADSNIIEETMRGEEVF